MNETNKLASLETAALIDLDAALKRYEAMAIRGQTDEMTDLRSEIHDVLDSILDLKAEKIQKILQKFNSRGRF